MSAGKGKVCEAETRPRHGPPGASERDDSAAGGCAWVEVTKSRTDKNMPLGGHSGPEPRLGALPVVYLQGDLGHPGQVLAQGDGTSEPQQGGDSGWSSHGLGLPGKHISEGGFSHIKMPPSKGEVRWEPGPPVCCLGPPLHTQGPF